MTKQKMRKPKRRISRSAFACPHVEPAREPRDCLLCSRPFWSAGWHNRICPTCKSLDLFMIDEHSLAQPSRRHDEY